MTEQQHVTAPEYGDSNHGDWDFACFTPSCRTVVFRGVITDPKPGDNNCPECGKEGSPT